MKNVTLQLILLFYSFNLIGQSVKNNSIIYIQDYYSSFSTGYDFDGKDIVLSNNYKAIFSGFIFTLTFDTFDEQKNLNNQTITINLKEVISLEPNGTDVVEIYDFETLVIPITGKLAFITADESYDVNIYYEVDEDVEQTKIYKAFEDLIKLKNKN
ncbi:hypothetical protein [Gillisia sp. CAL575]|uniref:hypothetical protein n=1 Tax=Gillisia sp. CAL575 TaxID=985255 RepID=UPI0005523A71|nr:hypothetical protein [Gillisia sp. CAL575]